MLTGKNKTILFTLNCICFSKKSMIARSLRVESMHISSDFVWDISVATVKFAFMRKGQINRLTLEILKRHHNHIFFWLPNYGDSTRKPRILYRYKNPVKKQSELGKLGLYICLNNLYLVCLMWLIIFFSFLH